MRIKLLIVMMIILGVCQLLGEIKVKGKLLIPTATGEKPYKCVMVIKRTEIWIECALKIFQPFNQFDTPKQAKIIVSKAEVEKIYIHKNKIYISTHESFYKRYRNILHHLYEHKFVSFSDGFDAIEKWIIIFVVDNPADIGCIEEDLIKLIN